MKPNGLDIKISYEISLAIYISLMVFLTLGTYLTRNKIEQGFFKQYYLYFYIGFMMNLINMTGFTLYYNKKKNNMVGDMGQSGDRGNKGIRGKTISCSFCEYNLYFYKTKKYTPAVTLNLSMENNQKLENDIKSFGFGKLGLDMDMLDLSFLTDIQTKSKTENIIKLLKTIFNFETRMNFLSFNLNKIIKTDEYSNLITFLRPIGGNGYYPIGYSVINKGLANKLNAFLVNGDIDFPEDYKVKFSFQNHEVLDRQGIEINKKVVMNYSFIKPIPKKGFVSLGELVVRNQNLEKIKPDANLVVCIRKSCAEEIDLELLKFMALKISFNSEDDSINKILNYSNNKEPHDADNSNNGLTYKIKSKDYRSVIDNETVDIYSVWKTPINTFITNTIVGNNNIKSGTIGYNIIGGIKKYISTNGFNLNKKGVNMITTRLKKIKLPKIIRITYIMMNQYMIYFNEIKYLLRSFVIDFNQELTTLKKRKKRLTFQQKKEVDRKIADIIKKTILFENIITHIESKDVYNDFDSLFDIETQEILNNNLPDYNKMKSKLQIIPELIETKITLYDMLFYLLPDGYDTVISMNNLDFVSGGIKPNNLQLELIKIVKVCFPPNEKIYIPKNECMAFNKIDIDRRNMISSLTDLLIKFDNFLLDYPIIDSNSDDALCNGENSLCTKIIDYINKIESIIYEDLSHIKGYKEQIKSRDFELFGNGRIAFLIEQYTKINEFINKYLEYDYDIN
jgi:hypothetical protein